MTIQLPPSSLAKYIILTTIKMIYNEAIMRLDNNYRSTLMAVFAAALLALAGCAKDSAQTAEAPAVPQKICKRVVVLPFVDFGTAYGSNKSVRGPLTRQVFVTDAVATHGELFMTKTLRRLLRAEPNVQWVTAQAPEMAAPLESGSRPELIRLLQSLGRRHKADGVLIGYLYAFRERHGGALGAESPAYVAFEVVLVSVESGQLAWQPKFSETQEPLNQNLFELGKFIQRKGRWVTAREMATQALKEMLQTFPCPTADTGTE
jgi:hypothetical protein